MLPVRPVRHSAAALFSVKVLFLAGLSCFFVYTAHAENGHDVLAGLLELMKNPPAEAPKPLAYIELDNDLMRCSGEGALAAYNNRGIALIKNRQFKEALKLYKAGIEKKALFLPFRYNIGINYLHLFDLRRALLHFNKARMIAPEYSKIYIQIGYTYELMNKYSKAVEFYRKALHRNRKELDTFVLIGNIHFLKNEHKMALRYYDAALKIDKTFPNALLGKAKTLLHNKKYIQSLVYLKSVDTRREYDKSFHFYFAECSYKLRDYKSAEFHYSELLKYKSNRFFLTTSPALIEHKLSLSRKFIQR